MGIWQWKRGSKANKPTLADGEAYIAQDERAIYIGYPTGTEMKFAADNAVSAKTADYTITDTDGVSEINVTTSTSKITVTLPTLADNQGRVITIMKIDTGAGYICVDGEGTEQILGKFTLDDAEGAAGALKYHIPVQYEGIKIKAISTGWLIVQHINLDANVGTLQAYAGDAAVPTGWVAAQGASQLRAGIYARLFVAIGVNWGTADATHFNLPDTKDAFLRGTGTSSIFTDNTKGTRSASATGGDSSGVGSKQEDSGQGHWHKIHDTAIGEGTPLSQNAGGAAGGAVGTIAAADTLRAGTVITDGTNGTPRISKENRPKNIEVYYIIKY